MSSALACDDRIRVYVRDKGRVIGRITIRDTGRVTVS